MDLLDLKYLASAIILFSNFEFYKYDDFSGNPDLQLDPSAVSKFTNYPLLGHINFGDNGFECVPVFVLSKLSDNLRLVSNQIHFPLQS